MTPLFVKAFKKENKCWSCKASKLTGYSVCSRHLLKARGHWRVWSAKRFEQGLCHSCHRRHIPGKQRCRAHTLINQTRCRIYSRVRYKFRKENGLYTQCRVGIEEKAVKGFGGLCKYHHDVRLTQNRARRQNA